MIRQACPICAAELAENPRYPNHLCRACAGRATAADGRPLAFSNTSIGGGFTARFADSGEAYPGGHDCFVDGVRCRADEAYFGGIVIVPAGAGSSGRSAA
ncbi:MAG: hypothetical protein ACXWUP_10645 [Allosphingosinicella sp.]